MNADASKLMSAQSCDSPDLLRDVEEYARARSGKIYSPIDHPSFSHVPCQHGAERFEPIRANLPAGASSALDIGTHWGYFAHMLERQGLKVDAVESSPAYLDFLVRIRALYSDTFEIIPNSVLDIDGPMIYDVVLALNIFHHFIKTKDMAQKLESFLSRLSCGCMFFQAHNPDEGQMKNSYMNLSPDDFCQYLIEKSPSLSNYRLIAEFGKRPMFILE